MLFNNDKHQIEQSIALLESKGYLVVPPIEGTIKSYKTLTEYFYRQICNRYNIKVSEFNWRQERLFAKCLVQQLSITGSYKDTNAIKLAKDIIDALLEDIDIVERYVSFDSIRLLIMDSTAWLLDIARKQISVNHDTGYSEQVLSRYMDDYDNYLESIDSNKGLLESLGVK